MPRKTKKAASPRPATRKYTRKFSPKRVMLFILLLISLFFTSFLLTGGTEIFGPHTIDNLSQTLNGTGKIGKLERALEDTSHEENSTAVDTEEITPTTWDRISRVMFLKNAVTKKLKNTQRYVELDNMPESLQQAVVSVEDGRFYDHWGFDVNGIARASLVNLQYGEVKEGASTITQQLVKNLFLSQEQSFGRKAEELVLSIDMELNYSKDEILEMYLNSIYFGSGYYGIYEASKGYFDKAPADLSLNEAAMLAGVPNAPSLYSPYVDFKLAKKRQIIVLDAMVKNGYLRENTAEDAKIKPIYLAH